MEIVPLARLSKLKSKLSITDTIYDSKLISLLIECTCTFEQKSKRNLRLRKYEAEAYSLTVANDRLFLKNKLAKNIDKIEIDGEEIDSDEYMLIGGAYVWRKEKDFPAGSHRIFVWYTAGMDGKGFDTLGENAAFNDVDPALEAIIIDDAMFKAEESVDLGHGRRGITVATRGGRGAMSMESVEYESYRSGFTSRYESMVKKYREYRMLS